jgi:hypothetical protein
MEDYNKKAIGFLNKIEVSDDKKEDLKTLAENLIHRKI